jgi:hypothetical protein
VDSVVSNVAEPITNQFVFDQTVFEGKRKEGMNRGVMGRVPETIVLLQAVHCIGALTIQLIGQSVFLHRAIVTNEY